QGLVDAIREYTQTTIYPYPRIQGDGQLPAVLVEPQKAQFDLAMHRGTDVWDFNLYVLVRNTDEALAQDLLDRFIEGEGPDSIRQALYENETLGIDGVADARVLSVDGYGSKGKWAGIDCLSAILKVRVTLDNSAA
ncbi:hypothetical protein, partial [Nocardia grenadensis]